MLNGAIYAGAAALFCLVMALYARRRHKQRLQTAMVRDRLAIEDEATGNRSVASIVGDEEEDEGVVASMLRQAGLLDRIQDLLDQAGERTTATQFLLRMFIFGLTGSCILGIALFSLPAAIVGMGLGAVPLFIVVQKRNTYMRTIDEQLPLALEIMTISLRAGHSLPKTLDHTAGEIQPPLAEELHRAAEEHAMGRSMEEVLVAMSRRLKGCRALRTFVVAVLVLQQTGGNLVEIIERIIETLRVQNVYERKLSAMTSEGKSSAKMLAALPPAFLVLAWLGDPGYVGVLWNDPAGQKVGFAAIGLWLLGVVWIRRLISPIS